MLSKVGWPLHFLDQPSPPRIEWPFSSGLVFRFTSSFESNATVPLSEQLEWTHLFDIEIRARVERQNEVEETPLENSDAADTVERRQPRMEHR